ncbi:MAG: AarF/ABC1/UbiB kinase family protein [Mycobacteriaceae bacterium]|nr:AarF/ABC1/UbiB kinase family protein [Mycobacteriaceae bacterium]
MVTGSEHAPVGPYADGPTPQALRVERPELNRFGIVEFARTLVIVTVVAVTTGWGALVGMLRLGDGGLRPAAVRRRLRRGAAEGTVRGFEILGPTFVKIGQLIASSPNTFPKLLADACLRCLDEVPPFSVKTVRKTLEADLGHPVEAMFAEFDDTPLSAASVAQVHGCVLRDGRPAVVKVQRPRIARRMLVDLRAAYLLSKLLERRSEVARVSNATGVVRDLHDVTCSELNFLVEANNQDRIRANVAAFGDNTGVAVPEVFWSWCGPKVVCMERMSGMPLDRFDAIRESHADTQILIRRLVKAWLEGVTVHGLFHGDVHAGNLWVLDDGRLAMLDFGIVGEMPAGWRAMLKALFYANAIDGDFARVGRALRELGVFDDPKLDNRTVGQQLKLVLGPILGGNLSRLNLSALTIGLLEFGKRVGISSPEPLILMAKQLGYFERYAIALAPDWNLGKDLYLFRNVFPDEVATRTEELGIVLPAV